MSQVTTMAAEERTPELPRRNHAAELVLADLERWSLRFAAGELQDGRGPLTGGERFAAIRAGVRAAGLGHPSTSGDLYTTDRRACVLAARGRTVREWTFADLADVSVLGNWGGLVLVHPGGDTELVVSTSPHPPTWRDATGWLKVEGAYAAGRDGRDGLGSWLSELPHRLSAAGGA
jgi:hypothetical protein